MFDFDVGEEGWVAEVAFAAGTDVVSVVGFVSTPASAASGLVGVF